MMKMPRPIIFLLLLLSTLTITCAAYSSTDIPLIKTTKKYLPFVTLPIPNTFSVEYVLKSGLFEIGKTKQTLHPLKDGRYVFTSTTKATGMFAMFFNGKITERSIWEYHEGRARPLQYSYKDTNKKKNGASLVFDWEKVIATSIVNGKSREIKITPDTEDSLIYQINIMFNLMENNNKKIIKLNIAGRKKLKSYDVNIQEKETIKTPAGKFETIRINRDDGKRVTTLWCAPSLNYLPVRIEHFKKGDTKVNAYLVNFKGLPNRDNI